MLFCNKRFWLLGLLFGNGAGLLLLLSGNPVTRRFLETAFPYTALGYYTGDFLLMLGLCLGGFVFPALLTFLARRSYALWGLLPLFLLLLWVVAGKAVNHTLSSLFDPPWVLPLVIFLCWAISCGPISLFRIVRQKYLSRPSVAPVFGTPPRRRRLLPALLLLPLLALVGLGAYNWKYPKTGHITVTSRLPLGETQVPLVVENEAIYVMASLNGQRQLCKIDTGSDVVLWDRSLHCAGVLMGGHGKGCDNENVCTELEDVALPHIQIGTFEVSNLPTSMQDTPHGLFSPPQKAEAETIPTLGNPLFALTVLTIDYRRKTLTIRPPDYDFQKQPRHSGDCILQMGWTAHSGDSKEEQKLFGWPTLLARVEGKPFRCVFDSGWGPQLGITENFLHQLPIARHSSQTVIKQKFLNSSSFVPQLDDLDFQFPLLVPQSAAPWHIRSQAVVVSSIGGGEGVVGMDLMKRCRITIDYQRRRILLELYDRTVPGQKQENIVSGAKQ